VGDARSPSHRTAQAPDRQARLAGDARPPGHHAAAGGKAGQQHRERGEPAFTLWLNGAQQDCPVPSGGALLLDAFAELGVAYRLAVRQWRDPALTGESLLVAVGALAAPLEIVHNGALPAVGVAHLWVRPGDEVVIGQPAYLRRRFTFYR
jgi:hypothetical protein